ncbi:MAG: hypothetical protein LBS80_06370, partial [Tannerella sp.]|nr:hypothetical protein [Tannerella sp.]
MFVILNCHYLPRPPERLPPLELLLLLPLLPLLPLLERLLEADELLLDEDGADERVDDDVLGADTERLLLE